LWISDVALFHPFDKKKYLEEYTLPYQSEALVKNKFEMITLYSGFKYNVLTGNYKVSVKGFKKKKK